MILLLLHLPPFRKLMQFLEILNMLAETADTQLLCERGIAYPLNYEDNQRVNTVYSYIKEHYREKITLATLAGLVHMNEESFSRFFSKTIHKPFFTYLRSEEHTSELPSLICNSFTVFYWKQKINTLKYTS